MAVRWEKSHGGRLEEKEDVHTARAAATGRGAKENSVFGKGFLNLEWTGVT